jgi:hypothetical protein
MPDLTEQIADRLASLFTVAELTQWLVSPQPLLDGAIPADLLAKGRDAEVLRVLDQIGDGAYL